MLQPELFVSTPPDPFPTQPVLFFARCIIYPRFCNACSRLTSSGNVYCCLCPRHIGAIKPTTNSKYWAHLNCTIWTPEAVIVDTQVMEPVNLRGIPKDRYQLQCSLCTSRKGACIQCAVRLGGAP